MQQQQERRQQNIIYFKEVPLRSPTKEQRQQQQESSQSLASREFTTQQLHKLQQLQMQFNKFCELENVIKESIAFDEPTIEHLCKSISDYVIYIVKYQHEEVFFQQFFIFMQRHAVQKRFIALLLEKVYHYKFLSDVVKKVFQSLEFLLRGMKKEDQFVYFMVSLNKQGFLTTKYQFQQDDSSYFANFLKLLARKINQDEKYLNIFFNQKQPHFPLLMNLLRLHEEKDMMLKTSVKLTLIQITSNESKLIKCFTNNFPFIIFYPIYVYEIYHAFLDAISDDPYKQQIGKENLKTTLKFMQDFIQTKDKQSIQMYTNCFMSLIGKTIYKQISQFNHKHPQRVIRMLKVLDEIVVKDITVLKIKIGMGQYFTKYMGKNLHKFLKSKTNHLDFSYWLIEQCKNDVLQHCQSIYMKAISEGRANSSPSRSSFLRTVNSYIPRSKDNWLYHQLKKISQLIGFEIELNKEINEQQYLQGSYLKAIEQDTKGKEVQNELYEKLVRNDNEEILFYYIKLVTELKVPLRRQGIDMKEDNQSIVQLLSLLSSVTSLSVLKSFYHFVLESEIHIDQNRNIKTKRIFQHVLERLIYFILIEGWATFFNRSKISLKREQHQSFSPDIFRDLQCDIVFFVALRHIFQTKNNLGIRDNKQLQNRDIRCTQTKANCFFVYEREDRTLIQEPIEVILDGQYIKLLGQDGKSIVTDDILINKCQILASQLTGMLEIVQDEKCESPSQQYYCLSFAQQPIKNYIEKEIKFRRQNIRDLDFKLRFMMFQFIE